MKRVVLEQSEREMLMGMIGDDSIDSWNAEFIEGKGRGQVILLYGMYISLSLLKYCSNCSIQDILEPGRLSQLVSQHSNESGYFLI